MKRVFIRYLIVKLLSSAFLQQPPFFLLPFVFFVPLCLCETLFEKNDCHYTVAKTSPGIYTIGGDILPIQIINSSQLSAEENLWLKNLRRKLGYTAITQIGKEINRQGKAVHIAAYWNAILHANPAAIKEAIEMKRISKLDRVFIETGWAAEWEAEGEARGRAEGRFEGEAKGRFGIAQNMVKLGLPIETVISATELDPEIVRTLYQA